MAGNILIVDDTPPVLKLLQDILGAEGYSVRPFNNGELALRSVQVEAPELILLDVRMPVIDGFEICRRIKADERRRDIPIIFISAASETEDKVRGFQAGGVDYITKPFQREEVVARVRTHITLHRARLQLLQTEQALRKSEQSLKIAQALAHLGHWEMEAATRGVAWSEETYRILGLDPATTRPSYERFLQAVHPEDRERVARHITQTWEGSDFDIEYRIVVPDGRIRVVQARGAPVPPQGDEGQSGIVGTLRYVREMVGVIEDITERKAMESQLEQEAHTDALTGCATRRYFMEMAPHEFLRSRRHGNELSVLMLDLDHFKRVNDAYGHATGDLTLQKAAQVCRGILRQEDLFGRLGGEEFAILLIETGRDKAFEVAERLREALAAAEIPLSSGSLRFTASLGVASMEAADAGIDTMLQRADQALYRAKNAGRNQVA